MKTSSSALVLSLFLALGCSSSGGAGGDNGGGSGGQDSGGNGGGGAGGSKAGGNGGSSTGGKSGNATGGGGGTAAGSGAGGSAGSAGGAAGARAGGAGGMAAGGAGGTAAGGAGGSGSATDNAYYNFEQNTQGWGFFREQKGRSPAATISTEHAYAGKSSLKVHIELKKADAGLNIGVDGTPFGGFKAGDTITARLWVPTGAKISASTFTGADPVPFGANQFGAGGFKFDGWTPFSWKVPAGSPTTQVFFIISPDQADWTGDVYIDSVEKK